MKDGVRQQIWGRDEMSATVLSTFYDMDMLYKVNNNKNNLLFFFIGAPLHVFGCNLLQVESQTHVSRNRRLSVLVTSRRKA